MSKNAQIHLAIESTLLNTLKDEALKKDVSISELCRQKLRCNPQLDRIEQTLFSLKEKI